jgi:hypothetical protein
MAGNIRLRIRAGYVELVQNSLFVRCERILDPDDSRTLFVGLPPTITIITTIATTRSYRLNFGVNAIANTKPIAHGSLDIYLENSISAWGLDVRWRQPPFPEFFFCEGMITSC